MPPRHARHCGVRHRGAHCSSRPLAIQRRVFNLGQSASAACAFGDCLHAGIAEILVDMLIQEGVLDPSFSLGSACSGIGVDTIGAARAARAHGGSVSRVFMSECNAARRRVLAHAFHIPPDQIYRDTASEAACDAPYADLWICTPPCVAHSRRNKRRSLEAQRDA